MGSSAAEHSAGQQHQDGLLLLHTGVGLPQAEHRLDAHQRQCTSLDHDCISCEAVTILTGSSVFLVLCRTAAVVCGLVYQQAAARGGTAPADPESSLDGDAASFCDHAVACLDVSLHLRAPSHWLRVILQCLTASLAL